VVLFAQVFRVGPVEHDLFHTLGLALAAVMLGVLAFRHVRSASARRPRLVATLALVALIVVIWAATEAGARLAATLTDQAARGR
jgi:bacteriorhodopsin